MKSLFFILLIALSTNSYSQTQPILPGVIHWKDLIIKKDGDRESREIAKGTTPEFEFFKIHATTQLKGAIAKPAHLQKDIEELIIIKEGTAKFTIENKTSILGKGSVVLIPPMQLQTCENVGDGSLTYYVFQFRSNKIMDVKRSDSAGGVMFLNYDSLLYTEKNNKGAKNFFNRPTAMCNNMEMHITYLKQKGPSHAPHQHVDTEIILLIDGDAEMMIDGKNYNGTAGDLFIMPSNILHGIGDASDKPCNYFAFKWR